MIVDSLTQKIHVMSKSKWIIEELFKTYQTKWNVFRIKTEQNAVL
jgi:hypothetical protein